MTHFVVPFNDLMGNKTNKILNRTDMLGNNYTTLYLAQI